MRNFIAIVVPTEALAFEALHALRELHGEGTITLYETAVVERLASGELATRQAYHDERPLGRTAVGALLGALAGAFGGPVTLVLGGAVGLFGGALDEGIRYTASDQYIDDIKEHLARGSFAVIAEVHETELAPIDARVAALGGTVSRELRHDFFHELTERQREKHRVEDTAYRLERASDEAQSKQWYVEADIHDMRSKLQRVAEEANEELETTKREIDRKLAALDAQVAKAGPATRKDLEQQVARIRKDLGDRETKLSRALQIARAGLHE